MKADAREAFQERTAKFCTGGLFSAKAVRSILNSSFDDGWNAALDAAAEKCDEALDLALKAATVTVLSYEEVINLAKRLIMEGK